MSRRALVAIAAGFCTLFIAFGIRYSYGLILPYMQDALGLSKTGAGLIFSSYFLTATLMCPIIGYLCDRYDARMILMVFVAILGAGTTLMSLATSVFDAAFYFAIAGIGHSACWVTVVTVIMRWVGPDKRGLSISIVDLGTTVGIAAWGLLIPIIVIYGDWRNIWACLGVTAQFIAVLNLWLIRSRPASSPGVDEQNNVLPSSSDQKHLFRLIMHDPKIHLIGFSYLLISFSILAPYTFLISFVTEIQQVPYAAASILLVVIAVAGAVGKLVLSYVSDRVGRIRIMMLCGVLTGGGSLLMLANQGHSLLLVAVIVFGIGEGALWAVYAASARDLFPACCAGSVLGVWSTFHHVGSIFSPTVSGWLIDTTGNYQATFILAALCSVVSCLVLIPLLQFEEARHLSEV